MICYTKNKLSLVVKSRIRFSRNCSVCYLGEHEAIRFPSVESWPHCEQRFLWLFQLVHFYKKYFFKKIKPARSDLSFFCVSGYESSILGWLLLGAWVYWQITRWYSIAILNVMRKCGAFCSEANGSDVCFSDLFHEILWIERV